jgi:hypothetical protein
LFEFADDSTLGCLAANRAAYQARESAWALSSNAMGTPVTGIDGDSLP